jgi:hypothetical protein
MFREKQILHLSVKSRHLACGVSWDILYILFGVFMFQMQHSMTLNS